MFPQQPQQQFRTAGADVQIFYGSGTGNNSSKSWNKPVGVSHVYMLLIGAGGNADDVNGYGGGSGAVTVWYGAAQHVPDVLKILVPIGPVSATNVNTVSGYNLLTANYGVAITAGAATVANQFAASGFYQSVSGQNGTNSGSFVSASTTTFLSGGALSGTTANYGYAVQNASQKAAHGIFQLQPIIVGVGGGGASGVGSNAGNGGIGCGAGVQGSTGASGAGGPGMVLIASW